MELVSFISIEDDPPDLVLLFAIWQSEAEDIRSLILLRTPEYEILPEGHENLYQSITTILEENA